MANRYTSELVELTDPAVDDVIKIVHTSEAVAADKDKKMRWDTFTETLSGNVKVVKSSYAADVDAELRAAIAGAASAGA